MSAEARRAAVEARVARMADAGLSRYSRALRDPAYRAAVIAREMELAEIDDVGEDPGDHDRNEWR